MCGGDNNKVDSSKGVWFGDIGYGFNVVISPNGGIELTKEYFLEDDILTCAWKVSWNERYSRRTRGKRPRLSLMLLTKPSGSPVTTT